MVLNHIPSIYTHTRTAQTMSQPPAKRQRTPTSQSVNESKSGASLLTQLKTATDSLRVARETETNTNVSKSLDTLIGACEGKTTQGGSQVSHSVRVTAQRLAASVLPRYLSLSDDTQQRRRGFSSVLQACKLATSSATGQGSAAALVSGLVGAASCAGREAGASCVEFLTHRLHSLGQRDGDTVETREGVAVRGAVTELLLCDSPAAGGALSWLITAAVSVKGDASVKPFADALLTENSRSRASPSLSVNTSLTEASREHTKAVDAARKQHEAVAALERQLGSAFAAAGLSRVSFVQAADRARRIVGGVESDTSRDVTSTDTACVSSPAVCAAKHAEPSVVVLARHLSSGVGDASEAVDRLVRALPDCGAVAGGGGGAARERGEIGEAMEVDTDTGRGTTKAQTSSQNPTGGLSVTITHLPRGATAAIHERELRRALTERGCSAPTSVNVYGISDQRERPPPEAKLTFKTPGEAKHAAQRMNDLEMTRGCRVKAFVSVVPSMATTGQTRCVWTCVSLSLSLSLSLTVPFCSPPLPSGVLRTGRPRSRRQTDRRRQRTPQTDRHAVVQAIHHLFMSISSKLVPLCADAPSPSTLPDRVVVSRSHASGLNSMSSSALIWDMF